MNAAPNGDMTMNATTTKAENWVLLGNGEVIERFTTELDAWTYAAEYDLNGYGFIEVAWNREAR